MEEGEKNYRYLQVTKEYPEEKSAISYVGIGEGIVGYTQDMAFYSVNGDAGTEKHVRKMSPSEVLSSEYRVYTDAGEVMTVRLDETCLLYTSPYAAAVYKGLGELFGAIFPTLSVFGICLLYTS